MKITLDKLTLNENYDSRNISFPTSVSKNNSSTKNSKDRTRDSHIEQMKVQRNMFNNSVDFSGIKGKLKNLKKM